MANKQHLKILMQGVVRWNCWRTKHREVRPDLSGAILQGARFQRIDLSGAFLRRADISKTDLSRADVHGADLTSVDLSQSNLYLADLANACLRKANLTGTNLSRAELTDTCFDRAVCSSTIFGDLDLRKPTQLKSIRHVRPSMIGIQTIVRSKGDIPKVFLRGAGVPETFIAKMKALVADVTPLDFYSCFISYSSKNRGFAEHLHASLQRKGVRCWFALEDLRIGDSIRTRIHTAIDQYDKLLVVISKNSIQSPWVKDEVEAALARESREQREILFPITLDNSVMKTKQAWAETLRNIRHIGDFRNWTKRGSYRKAFARLLRDLKAEGNADSVV